MTLKTPLFPTGASASAQRKADGPRGMTSQHIAEHVAAFQARGGKVEVLGNTWALKRLKAADAARPTD